MLSTGNAQLFGNGVNVSDTLEHDVARAIAQFEVSLFGSEDEKLVSHFMSLVDHTKIGRILERVSAGSSPDEAVRLYAPLFSGGQWFRALQSENDSPDAPPSQTTATPKPPLPSQSTGDIELLEPSGTERVNDVSTSPTGRHPKSKHVVGLALDGVDQKGPLPRQLSNHNPLVLSAGLFRTMPKSLINKGNQHRPVHESDVVHPLAPGVMRNARAMTLTGPILDTDFDARTYLCMVSILGNLTSAEYDQAVSHPMEITPEMFYEAVLENMGKREADAYIRDLIESKKIVATCSRLRSVALTFYDDLSDAENPNSKGGLKGNVLIAGLVSHIELLNTGYILLRPDPAMKTMYRETCRLIPINSSSILSLDHQFSLQLALWIPTLSTRQFDSQTGWVMVNRRYTVREILEQVHPLDPGQVYQSSHRKMVHCALLELIERDVLKINVMQDGARVRIDSQNSLLFTLPKSRAIIEIVSHRISHSESRHQRVKQLSVDVLDDNSSSKVLASTISDLLKSISWKGLRQSDALFVERMSKQYATTIHKSGELIAELNERDELAAIRLLRTIVAGRRQRLGELFGAVLVGSEKEIFNQLTAKAWTVGKSAPPTNCRLREILLSLPTEKSIHDYKTWAHEHGSLIEEFIALATLEENAAAVKALNGTMLKSRLLGPLDRAKMAKESKAIQLRR